jgi:1-acyl-sn-glycerol-3-phosphate acyltransferase
LVICKLFFRIKAVGQENVPPEGPLIVAVNHVSYLDPVLAGVAVPRITHYMAKKELFKVPLFKNLIFGVNAFPVDRDNPDLSTLHRVMDILKRGEALLLFPEGTRGDGINFLPPKQGAGMIVHKTKAPVLPVFVHGSEKVWPRKNKFPRPASVTVYIGKSLTFAGKFDNLSKKEAYSEIARQIMSAMAELKKNAEVN